MHLEIEQREKDGIVILDLKGRLIMGEEDLSLRQRLASLGTGPHKVILNFKEVSDIDTAGLGTLAFYVEKSRGAGGKLAVLNLSPSHTKLADILKLSTVFDVYQEEQDAVNSFFPERAVPHFDILEFVEHLEQPASDKNDHKQDDKKDQPG
jgi:anti-sigma B factor antagonist